MKSMHSLHYRHHRKKDLHSIADLLINNELPVSDLHTSNVEFILSTSGENVVGCIGIECYGKDGLIRSFAVDSSHRNKGIGTQLLQRLLAYSRQLEIDNLHLLTTTAEKYFQVKGFTKINRDDAPKAVKASAEFSSICPSSSTYMTLKQIRKHAIVYTDDVRVTQIDAETESKYWAIKGEKSMFTYFEVPANKTFDEHYHESEQITHVLEGELFFEIKGEVLCVGQNDSIVIPSNIPHKVWTEEAKVRAVDSWTPINDKYE